MPHTNTPTPTQGRMKRSVLAASISALLLSLSVGAQAVNAFDPQGNVLTLDRVALGGTVYRNVGALVGSFSLLGVDGGTPGATVFDPASSTLYLGSVAFGGERFNNVRVKINSYDLRTVGQQPTAGTLEQPTYASTSAESAGFLDTINDARTQCGFPALAQNTRLDRANDGPNYKPADLTRARELAFTAGYARPVDVDAVNSTVRTPSKDGYAVGRAAALQALNEDTALMAFMRNYTEIGLRSFEGVSYSRTTTAILGNPVPRNLPGVQTYPCANSTDVQPYSKATLSGTGTGYYISGYFYLDACWQWDGRCGPPVAVFGGEGQDLQISEAIVSSERTGDWLPVAVKKVPAFANEALVMTTVPMEANAAYRVRLRGTTGNAPFQKEFVFRTGSAIAVPW